MTYQRHNNVNFVKIDNDINIVYIDAENLTWIWLYQFLSSLIYFVVVVVWVRI